MTETNSLENALASFVSRTKPLIELERKEELEAEAVYSSGMTIQELEARGLCVSRLVAADTRTGLYGRTLVTFESTRGVNLSGTGFGVRDVVQLRAANSMKGAGKKQPQKSGDGGGGSGATKGQSDRASTSGVVYRVQDKAITVSFEQPPAEEDLKGHVVLLLMANDM